MIDVDEYYKRIERKLVGEFKSTGKIENAFLQNIGKTIAAGDIKRGQMFSDMIDKVERAITGQKKHGFEQNKLTDTEKLIRKGEKDVAGN